VKKYHLKSYDTFTPSIDYASHLNPGQLAGGVKNGGTVVSNGGVKSPFFRK